MNADLKGDMQRMSFSKKQWFLRLLITLLVCVFAYIFFSSAFATRNRLVEKYEKANELIKERAYEEAIELWDSLGDYKESIAKKAKERLKEEERELAYKEGLSCYEREEFDQAREIFIKLGDYRDSTAYVISIDKILSQEANKERIYAEAIAFYTEEKYIDAIQLFEDLGNYKMSSSYIIQCCTALLTIKNSNTISAGVRISAAVSQNNRVEFCGEYLSDEEIVQSWEDIVSVAITGEFLLGLKKDGSVVTAKANPQCTVDTSGWNNIVAISAGQQYVVGLQSNGKLKAQGMDGYGETDIDKWENIVSISTAWQLTVGLDMNGCVKATGYKSADLLAEIEENQEGWEDVIAIAAGGGRPHKYGEDGHIVGLKRDGTVVAVGDNRYGQCDVDSWENIVAISAGAFHTVGLTATGEVLTTQDPVRDLQSCRAISEWEDIVAISAGYGYTMGLKRTGEVKVAGINAQGQDDTSSWDKIAFQEEWDSYKRTEIGFEYNNSDETLICIFKLLLQDKSQTSYSNNQK